MQAFRMSQDGDTRKSLGDLLAVMAALRDPDTGCPWDIAQTFSSIAPYTIEEAYEVADAIARHDMDSLRDELGDLLLQVVYHAQLAHEAGAFNFSDVADGIVRKMVRRHPHVFGEERSVDRSALNQRWEGIKQQEREEHGELADASVLADIPIALPALSRALKLQNRAARVGFDWPSLDPVYDKLDEEIVELKQSATYGSSKAAEEIGDLLFVVANIGRHLGIDPEDALRGANAKFERRFRGIEAKLRAAGKLPAQSTLEEMDALWDAVKEDERRELS